jgi:hypothetical protein
VIERFLKMNAYDRFLINYQRRYIRTGSAAPVFHVMLGLFTIGVLMEARVHRLRVKEGAH